MARIDCKRLSSVTGKQDKPQVLSVALSCSASNCKRGLVHYSAMLLQVGKQSKHCRACDICTEGFDHHCWWLSSCVGRKNYRTFVAMLASTLALLLLDSFVGVAVFIRYWVDFESLANEVIDKLGSNYLTSSPAIVAVMLYLHL
jgi:hypothetical protein